ncbi:hypothetical protein LZ575_10180 [Antarcticibacterium sp. 1MA-6-2]|uniref:hypothetical protein n=1 Tax=Antarcticibacterium sp. 1MA-6-2 TaxID=2908210 RepID=UPI001F2B8F14|nr:hypothetical protein [Antarcticibacterium sp. 1MA-6-2]UJH92765.1 hypothetical protein LZ575_10180 [Antarcticibacterium sp. 1MA-6-2]
MKYKFFISILLLAVPAVITAQEVNLSVGAIAPALLENTNAVLRNEEVFIEVAAVDKLIQKKKRIITVLNEHGNDHVQA